MGTTDFSKIKHADDIIMSDTRITVGMLKQMLDGVDDDAEILAPFTLFGQLIETLEIAGVVLSPDGKMLGIQVASPDEADLLDAIYWNGQTTGTNDTLFG